MKKIITDAGKIEEILKKGVEKIYPSQEALEKLLKSGKRIRLYCGFDPTSPSLHIGNAIQLRKLAQFQKLGHEVIFLIGDFTGMIGDPSDKTAARKKLNKKEILENLKNYKKQASKILDFSGKNPAKVLYNGEWNNKLKFGDLIELASNFTVQQMITRDMFRERIKNNKPIYLHEFLYPLAQAYDSVAMDVDLEIGGNDQTFNMLCGRDLMKILKNKEKLVLTTKLLADPSGKKMGKTEGNMINLDEKPEEMYGKIMSWSDELIIPGFELCTDFSLDELAEISDKIKTGKVNPRDEKAKLAKAVVSIHYDKKTAEKTGKEFDRIFREKKEPLKIRESKFKEPINIVTLLFEDGLVSSKGEAKRLIKQGGVEENRVRINDYQKLIDPRDGNKIIRVGREFIKVTKKH
jgi:tyrosyl-tRNA synthetase